jgi:hypothetical protein
VREGWESRVFTKVNGVSERFCDEGRTDCYEKLVTSCRYMVNIVCKEIVVIVR